MYIPPAFREERPEVLRELMRAYPLATVVASGADGLSASQVPFVVETTAQGDVLRAHLARVNDQVAALQGSSEALVVFSGPDAYVSPSWYATKAEHGRVVPTWNYATVHVWGRPTIIESPEWLLSHLRALTDHHEAGRAEPWSIDDAPADYIAALTRGIVGLEIPVARIEGKWKASQNQPAKNRRGVVAGLTEQGSEAMAALVPLSDLPEA
jgi:transcriptional regulator